MTASRGSLGIDYLWNNDHLFHPIAPADQDGALCAPTDADGHAFANQADFGEQASAPAGGHSFQPLPPSARCPKTQIHQAYGTRRFCPAGSGRIVFMGMLGLDATSITYRTPRGAVRTERTAGPDGAYLIVLRADHHNCKLYQVSADGSGDGSERASLIGCAPVGWVAPKTHVSEADVASPITVKAVSANRWCVRSASRANGTIIPCNGPGPIPAGYSQSDLNAGMRQVGKRRVFFFKRDILFNISFIARQPVTQADAGYGGLVQDPKQCGGGGTGIGFDRPLYRGFHVGERLTTQILLPAKCAGSYQGIIMYNPTNGPDDQPEGLLDEGFKVGTFKLVVPRRH